MTLIYPKSILASYLSSLLLILPLNVICGQFQNDSIPSTDWDSIAISYDFSEFVVTAQYAPTHIKNAIQNIRTINRISIEKSGATNLEQLLRQDLNIRISHDMQLGSSMKLQGVEGENIKIMIDGIPIIGRLDGNIDLGQINLDNILRVEIIEGPMSVNYGSDALGGVINLITKKSQVYKYEIGLKQQFETRGENRSIMNGGIRLGESWLLRLNLGRDYFGGFSTDTLRSQLWNPKEQYFGDLSIRKEFLEDHQINYRFSMFDENVENQGEKRRPQYKPYAFDEFFNTKRINHSLIHEGSLADRFYIQSTAGYSQFNRFVDSYRYEFETEESSLQKADSTQFVNFLLRTVLASKIQNSKWQYQVGFDGDHEIGSGGKIALNEDSTKHKSITNLALFGTLRYEPLKSILLETGIRYINNSKYQAPLIPSFNVKWDLNNKWTLRSSYARGFRSPSLKELYISFIDINHYIIGNEELVAETSNNIQFNLKYRTTTFRFPVKLDFQAFYNLIQDQISLYSYQIVDGEILPSLETTTNQYTYFNLEKAIYKGTSIKLQLDFDQLSVDAGLFYLGYFNELSERFPDVDRYTYVPEVSANMNYFIKRTQSNLSLSYRYSDKFISYYPTLQNGELTGTQLVLDGYSNLDFIISQKLFKSRLSIQGGVRNILDVQTIGLSNPSGNSHQSNSIVPIGMGRSYFVNINIKLAK